MAKRMKIPTPEVAYLLGLVAAQKHQVAEAELAIEISTLALVRALSHLKGLEAAVDTVRRDNSKARARAAMPWLSKE